MSPFATVATGRMVPSSILSIYRHLVDVLNSSVKASIIGRFRCYGAFMSSKTIPNAVDADAELHGYWCSHFACRIGSVRLPTA